MRKIPKEYYIELAIFLAHHHSGQCSRGYRLLCKLMKKYNIRWNSGAEKEAEESFIYQYLFLTYSDLV